jgi:hypothetical protein
LPLTFQKVTTSDLAARGQPNRCLQGDTQGALAKSAAKRNRIFLGAVALSLAKASGIRAETASIAKHLSDEVDGEFVVILFQAKYRVELESGSHFEDAAYWH